MLGRLAKLAPLTNMRDISTTPRLRPYPAYKDSGVEWLGQIPAHWEVNRLKHIATINDEALPETTDPCLELAYADISSVDAAETCPQGLYHQLC